MAAKRLCAVEGCGKPYHAYGYCSRHAYHFKVHGDPLGGRRGASPGEPQRWIKENASYQGDDCLIWPFERTRHGYGTVRQNGKKRVASRVMCEEAHGEAPSPKHEACHSCGRGDHGCMTPKHLRWGTKFDNSADRIAHGTWIHGETVPASKLTRDQVIEIAALKGTMTQRQIAEKFGVGVGAVGHIHAAERWKWLGYEVKAISDFSRGEKHYFAKLNEDAVRKIRALEGVKSRQELAHEFGVSVRAIRAVHVRELWKWVD